MSRPSPQSRSDYVYFLDIPTRWSDNDVYGHVNNAIYYFYFDTLVNRYLIENGLLEIGRSKTIGLVVDTGCAFFSPLTFPDIIQAGLRVARLGSSSVRYEIGLFRNDQTTASAQGHFVHVYVNEASRRPVSISAHMREQLELIHKKPTQSCEQRP